MTSSKNYSTQIKPKSVWHEIRGVRYHVTEWGDRQYPLLFLLHGWGDCGASFQFFVDRLEKNWFVVAPDWRGFGLSYFRCESYWFPDYIADLHTLLNIYEPSAPVNLLGHSMGANVATLYAGIFPDRVCRVINVEGFGLGDSDPTNAPDNYRRWIELSNNMPAYKVYKTYDELADRIIKRNPAISYDRAIFVAQNWATQVQDGSIVLRADPAHKLPNAVQYRRAEAEACWAAVTAPMLIVLGETTNFKEAFKALIGSNESRNAFDESRSVVISGAGHMVHLEQPTKLATATEKFLTQNQG
ncbi:MAG: alpha/beta hydrolase [Woeseia sp.]|nr:alpha/beta hydrolase [Woeseia sp.]|tara:strand:+ start:4296 stop:5195 length:900 start_codon:yes stop_codon:yes gene_type:complete